MLWIVEIVLDILQLIPQFNVFTLIVSILFVWFYFYVWKSMSYIGTAFGIVFKSLGIILILVVMVSPQVLAKAQGIEVPPSFYVVYYILSGLVMLYYFISLFFFVKAFKNFK